jgi:hypothetical protein
MAFSSIRFTLRIEEVGAGVGNRLVALPTIPAATDTAPSARVSPAPSGSPTARASYCRFRIDRLMMARDALDAFEHRELIDDINWVLGQDKPTEAYN